MKTVYLATPKGPKAYLLEGVWLTEADDLEAAPPAAKKPKQKPKANGARKPKAEADDEGTQATMD